MVRYQNAIDPGFSGQHCILCIMSCEVGPTGGTSAYCNTLYACNKIFRNGSWADSDYEAPLMTIGSLVTFLSHGIVCEIVGLPD